MKVVQINTVCGTGSTGKIALSLYQTAQKNSYHSYYAYGRGAVIPDSSYYKIGNKADFLLHVLINFFQGKSGYGSYTTTRKFLKWLDLIQPDILHLHNIHGFYLHAGLFFRYIKKHSLNVVWTLHDCWPFTGQCAHFTNAHCDKWRTGCSHCPIYRSDYPYSLFKDNSKNNYLQKRSDFCNVPHLQIVTPSYWLADLVRQSFLKDYPVTVIPNGIDLQLFKPMPPEYSMTGKKILLGVANVWTARKGLDFFLDLAKELDPSYHIVLIGVDRKLKKQLEKNDSVKITAITRTENQTELAKWYSSAYVYINPTLEDNFPTTNLEALACGTPVITFETGGSPESLDESCGIIVKEKNTGALKNAILSLSHNPKITSESCRRRALEYDKDFQFQKYIEIYQQFH